ncbi:MAG: hypothetical protein PWQ55_718 [Chloroflexota bacterium]|nr:hypothetical protein [Chloroflexota bacterium]
MDNYGDFALTFVVIFFIAAIVAFVFLAKKSSERSAQSERMVNQIMSQLSSDKQTLFAMQYQNVKKNPTTAVLLALFLGGLGIHKFYLNKPGLGILYLLFCWSTIPAIISFFEAFTIAGKVGEYNEQKAREISAMI